MAASMEDISSHLHYDYNRLTREHAALNQRIASLLNEPEPAYQALILTLKRIKLAIKDQLSRLERPLTLQEQVHWQKRNGKLFEEKNMAVRHYRLPRLAVAA